MFEYSCQFKMYFFLIFQINCLISGYKNFYIDARNVHNFLFREIKYELSYYWISFTKKNRNHICQNYQNIFYIDQNL